MWTPLGPAWLEQEEEQPEQAGTAGKARGESVTSEGNRHRRNTSLAIKFDIDLDKALH